MIKTDKGEFATSTRIDGKKFQTKEYQLWKGIVERCYSGVYQQKYPTYIGCTMSENFKSFQYFAKWCQSQKGFKEENFQIDKDLLQEGTKHYSEDICVFIPIKINYFLLKHKSRRGEFPLGVYWSSYHRRFRVTINNGCGRNKYIGVFLDTTEVFNAYKAAKEAMAKELAVFWTGKVDPRVIEALNNYVVEITD